LRSDGLNADTLRKIATGRRTRVGIDENETDRGRGESVSVGIRWSITTSQIERSRGVICHNLNGAKSIKSGVFVVNRKSWRSGFPTGLQIKIASQAVPTGSWLIGFRAFFGQRPSGGYRLRSSLETQSLYSTGLNKAPGV